MDEWIKIISQVGFPIAVTAYLLLRLETTIQGLTKVVNRLIIVLARKGLEIEVDDEPGSK